MAGLIRAQGTQERVSVPFASTISFCGQQGSLDHDFCVATHAAALSPKCVQAMGQMPKSVTTSTAMIPRSKHSNGIQPIFWVSGGSIWPIETLASVMDGGRRHHLALHLD